MLAAVLAAPVGDHERRRLLGRMAAVLPWGEEDPAEIERFRAELRAAFGERAPRVLDRSPEAGRFRWRRCGWGAMRRRRT